MLEQIGKQAIEAKYDFLGYDTEKKNELLCFLAQCLRDKEEQIIVENKKDLENGVEKGMSKGLLDRLALTPERIWAMAEGLELVAKLPDPIGEELEAFERPNGLKLSKVRVPLGVIGIIYESRPNVTADAFALCFKTSNAVVLKGGSDAIHSNRVIVAVLREGLEKKGINPNVVQLIDSTDRAVTKQFMEMRQYIDVLIPRGGAGLIRSVVENSKIPVIETGTGNCHVYVDKDADLDMAVEIIRNAKTQRIGVCNACESLVLHKDIEEAFLPKLAKSLEPFSVELRGDAASREILTDITAATEEDYGTEYLDYILSMKTVSSVEEAVEHINRYNTKHSEAIVTSNQATADYFLDRVDAACVYHNASTRFTDGFEFGFGAEIGISTQMLHARGPMGLRELTSYKYKITGNGQIRR